MLLRTVASSANHDVLVSVVAWSRKQPSDPIRVVPVRLVRSTELAGRLDRLDTVMPLTLKDTSSKSKLPGQASASRTVSRA